MKKIVLFFAISFLSVFFVASVFAAEATMSNLPVERFALYIGCNDGGKSREQLLYAGTDACNFQKTMAELGGVPASNSQLLVNPDKDDIVNALNGFVSIIEKRKEFAKRTEFIFYYSGHSDEDSLLLGSTLYDYTSLKAAITEVPSDVHVVILDSCFSGNFIRAKGGKRSQAFLTDDSTIVQGHAYLSSSSSSESSQESDEIQSSFFTNAMLTGLRGAADTSQDNKVSLNELYYYAFNETISKTQNSAVGPQHPSYNITLVGSGDLILTDISQAESTVIIPKEEQGRFIFRNSRGVLVSEINKIAGSQISIALESDDYEVTVIDETSTKQGKFTLKKKDTYIVSASEMKNIKRVKNTLRGDEDVAIETVEDEQPDDDVAIENDNKESAEPYFFKIGLVSPLTVNLPGAVRDGSVYFLVSSEEYIRNSGIQLSLIGNSVETNMKGMQLAAIYNSTKTGSGFQMSAIINTVTEFSGFQMSIVNHAKSIKGAQLGLVNFARKLDGVQIGLINFAGEAKGGVFGLLNFVKNGVHELDFFWDTKDLATWQYRGGTKAFYTALLISGNDDFYKNNRATEYYEFGLGFGSKIEVGWFDFDFELTGRGACGNYDNYPGIYPSDAFYYSFRTTAGFGGGFFGILAGVSCDFLFEASKKPLIVSRYKDNILDCGNDFFIAPTFYWGFKIQ